jgi:hypothetical protein
MDENCLYDIFLLVCYLEQHCGYFSPITPFSLILEQVGFGYIQFLKTLDNSVKNRYIFSKFKGIFWFPQHYGMDLTS